MVDDAELESDGETGTSSEFPVIARTKLGGAARYLASFSGEVRYPSITRKFWHGYGVH